MKTAIIGAGFAGLAAGHFLSKQGVKVALFEKGGDPGGLATGYKKPEWDWPLEQHYHHWFTNDKEILSLAKEIGHPFTIKRPKTSNYLGGDILQLDSPISLLKFQHLSVIDRLRTGLVLAFLKITPFWKPLESITAANFINAYMGESSWKILWEPLFQGKFGKKSKAISAAWFWARIKKRTPSLVYPEGGFENFAKAITNEIIKKGGRIFYKTQIKQIEKKNHGFVINAKKFDKIISTVPFPVFLKVAPTLPDSFKKMLEPLNGIGAISLILRLKKQFLKDGTYWLSINEKKFPFLAVVEHTNFISQNHYGGEHLVYVGKYLAQNHPYFGLTDEKLFRTYLPYLKKINPDLVKNLIAFDVFKATFAQPIFPLSYSGKNPKISTPVKGLYLATMQQVYPWDRGTNYAVKIGKEAAKQVLRDE